MTKKELAELLYQAQEIRKRLEAERSLICAPSKIETENCIGMDQITVQKKTKRQSKKIHVMKTFP